MRVMLFANNRVGRDVAEWLVRQEDELVALAVHSDACGKYVNEIRSACGLDEERVIDGSTLRDPSAIERIRSFEPEVGVSVFFGYILRRALLNIFPKGCVNLHPALLPYNRGAYPNVWSIIDGTPAGATLHYMDEGIDTGDILAQREVAVTPVDTGESLYRRLEDASTSLFVESWPAFRRGDLKPKPQDRDAGTMHRVTDVDRIDRIDLDATYTGRELINLIRARTFAGHSGAYFEHEGKRVYVSISLENHCEAANGV